MTFHVFLQFIEAGHYCLPEEGSNNFVSLSQQIEEEFISLLKHGRPLSGYSNSPATASVVQSPSTPSHPPAPPAGGEFW